MRDLSGNSDAGAMLVLVLELVGHGCGAGVHVLGFAQTWLRVIDRVHWQACVTSGFFYLVNHGVDQELLDDVFAQSKKFFALPLEEKTKVIHDKNHRGYTPFEEEVLDPEVQSKGKPTYQTFPPTDRFLSLCGNLKIILSEG